MLGRIESLLRNWRRLFSRSEWLTHLLKLPVSSGTQTEPGLILIQIDGLSYNELQQALQHGEMPFLSRLIDREYYQLHHQYTGIPSTTSAVQGELFYGVKAAVPSFNFMQHESKRLVRMYEPTAAVEVEHRLTQEGHEPLLTGGSCYADNFTGGAAEPHYCPSSLGWGSTLRNAHPLVLVFLIISNVYSFVRTGALMLLEMLLAMFDFVRGLVDGRNIWAEFKFIPTRVFIVILLRELITIGVKIDAARGLPIIHLNFLGYDEQAHRRGPSSLFAHWTLRGIDDAIARIWRASQRSNRRSYDVWIYSDHGQQQVVAYEKIHNRSFAEAATQVFSQYEGKEITCRSGGQLSIQLQRIQMLGGKRIQQFFNNLADTQNNNIPTAQALDNSQLTVASLGPVAHLYYDHKLSPVQLNTLAMALVNQAKVPLVLFNNGDNSIHACTQAGEFSLEENKAMLLGAEHPYLDAVCEDLIALCIHPDAGALIACGYCPGGQALSFSMENGAHGGSSNSETSAFALTPADIDLEQKKQDMSPSLIRPGDLRNAALRFLGRSVDIKSTDITSADITGASKQTHQQTIQSIKRKESRNTIRIMTYNVHSCIGMDGKLAPERIARVIARYKPDIVALQELDVGRLRTNEVDQAHCIAHCLEMEFHFHPAQHIEEERYGNAILTHLPMRLVKTATLPGLANKPQLEPRSALWVAINAGGTEIQLINTHLGLRKSERKAQVQSLLSSDWLEHADCRSPVILCGDFNTMPDSNEWCSLHNRLPDAQVALANHKPKNTFFSRLPSTRIDHVFVDNTIGLLGIETPNSELVRLASDHLPLVVDISLHQKC